jgi:hypothetical protein
VVGPVVAVEARAESRPRSILLVVAVLAEGRDGVAPFLGQYGLRPVGTGYIVGVRRARASRGAVTGDHVQRQSSASESQDKLPVTTTKDKRLFTRRTFRGIFAVPIPGMMT